MARLLRQNDMIVDAVATIDEASAALRLAHYDAILLDLSLPDGDGTHLLRRLRAAGNAVPVLVATARTEIVHRVHTLNDGADDYLVKPFSLDELLARIRALLRRPPQRRPSHLEAGNLSLDTETLAVTVDGHPFEVPRGEARVLATLLQRDGRLVSKEALEQAVYAFDTEVTANAIEASVSRLRRRLETGGASITVTAMRGLGYILSERTTC